MSQSAGTDFAQTTSQQVTAGGAQVVLLVDDDRALRELNAEILADEGFAVHTATNGRGALQVLTEHKIDLVISDVNMDGMDGFALIRAIRGDQRHASLPVIFISGVADNEGPIRERGATDFLSKGDYGFTDFLAMVRKYLPLAARQPAAASVTLPAFGTDRGPF